MKHITLTNSTELVIVDDEDYEKAASKTWALTPHGYARRNVYEKIDGKWKRKKLYLHRFLMNPKEDEVVDHINRNPLDCRRSNMRNVTRSINNLNRTVPKNHSTGVNGVNVTKSGKYLVTMSIANKTKSFGVYDDFHFAVNVRKRLEQKRYEGNLV